MVDTAGPGASANGALSGRRGRYRFEVRGNDTDRRDRLAPHALFSMMQEAASLHAEHLGFGAAQFDPQGIAWVLLRVSVRMDAFPSWKDALDIETWPSARDRLYGIRDFRFRDGEGRPLGGATSAWLVVDTATRRPKRMPPEAGLQDGESPERALPAEAPKVEADPALDAAAPVLRVACRESDIDRNRHVNNARYVAWCVDALQAAGLGDAPVAGLDMNYLSELLLGDEAELRAVAVAPGEVLVDGRRSDGEPVFRARVLLADAP